ncbi:TatD family hydrolase [Candidatus Micrarchaeota archaeon]|nr:TatD family hydrolase [Candidatus Micrarchaeota archaeon]
MFDGHAHLTHEKFQSDVESVIARARQSLSAVLCIGTSQIDSEHVLSLCQRHPRFLYPVIGLSPHDAVTKNLPLELSFLKKHAEQAIAIGEIGLEYHYFKEKDHAVQIQAFRAQLELAESFSKPVQIHLRESHAPAFEILAEFPKLSVILHCFYAPPFLSEALRRHYTLSLSTMKNKARDTIIKKAPLSSLQAETDSPYLWLNGRNESKNVQEVYERISSKRNIPISEVDRVLSETARRIYGIEIASKGL